MPERIEGPWRRMRGRAALDGAERLGDDSGWPEAKGVKREVENFVSPAYNLRMDAPEEKAPSTWVVEALARSNPQIAAGQTVPLDRASDRLRASIERMKAVQSTGESKPAYRRVSPVITGLTFGTADIPDRM